MESYEDLVSPVVSPVRFAQRFVTANDIYPFVIVTEIGDDFSRRSSPFQGRGFRGHPERSVMSAPGGRRKRNSDAFVPITGANLSRRRVPRLCNTLYHLYGPDVEDESQGVTIDFFERRKLSVSSLGNERAPIKAPHSRCKSLHKHLTSNTNKSTPKPAEKDKEKKSAKTDNKQCNCCCCKERRIRKETKKLAEVSPLTRDVDGSYHCCCCKGQAKDSATSKNGTDSKNKKKSILSSLLKSNKSEKNSTTKKDSNNNRAKENNKHHMKPMAGLLRATSSRRETTKSGSREPSSTKEDKASGFPFTSFPLKKLVNKSDTKEEPTEQIEQVSASKRLTNVLNVATLGKKHPQNTLRNALIRKVTTLANITSFSRRPVEQKRPPSSASTRLGALASLTNFGKKPPSRPPSQTGSRSGSRPGSSFSNKLASVAGFSTATGMKAQQSRPGSRPGSSFTSKLATIAGFRGSAGRKFQPSRPSSKTGSRSGSQSGSGPGSRSGSRPTSRTGSRSSSRPGSSFSSKLSTIAGISSTVGRKSQPSRPASRTGSRPASRTGSRPASSTRRMTTLVNISSGLRHDIKNKHSSGSLYSTFRAARFVAFMLRSPPETIEELEPIPESRFPHALETITKMKNRHRHESSAVIREEEMEDTRQMFSELRPEWTIEEEATTYCFCCVKKKKYSSEITIQSESDIEDNEYESDDENEEEYVEEEELYDGGTTSCFCWGRNKQLSSENVETESQNKHKTSLFCCSRSEASVEEVPIEETNRLAEIQLTPASLERKSPESEIPQRKWAVKTMSQENEYEPPTKKKRAFFCCCKPKNSENDEIIIKTSAKHQKKNSSGTHKLPPSSSTLQKKKCKFCWLCCCCGCTFSNKPQMKSRAVQAESAEIRSSMLLKPTQLRIPSPNSSGDALVIQSVSSAENRHLTAETSHHGLSSRGSSKEATAIQPMSPQNPQLQVKEKIQFSASVTDGSSTLDPNVQRSVSAVMRHLSPERSKGGCFTCCFKRNKTKSSKSSRKPAKQKFKFPCFGRKKRKGSSKELLSSKAKSPIRQVKGKESRPKITRKSRKRSPEIHPVSARRKPSLREKLCGCYGKPKVPNRVPLKERRNCCSCWRFPWFKRGRGPDPPSKEKDKQGCCRRLFCSCCKRQTEAPKPAGQKQGLCRRIFCCCSKPKAEQPPAQLAQPPPPSNQRNQRMPLKKEMTKPNFWKRLFCCKCQNRTNDMGSRKSFGSKKDMIPKSRASSIASFPKLEATLVEHTSLMKAAIPVLPICLAWTCLILNIFLPGTGTILSGFLCICFGKPRFSVKDSTFARFGSLFINLVIGIGQLFTIIFCFVGWGWSIWWGVIMVRLARKYRRIKIAEKNANEPPVVNQNHDVEHGN